MGKKILLTNLKLRIQSLNSKRKSYTLKFTWLVGGDAVFVVALGRTQGTTGCKERIQPKNTTNKRNNNQQQQQVIHNHYGTSNQSNTINNRANNPSPIIMRTLDKPNGVGTQVRLMKNNVCFYFYVYTSLIYIFHSPFLVTNLLCLRIQN